MSSLCSPFAWLGRRGPDAAVLPVPLPPQRQNSVLLPLLFLYLFSTIVTAVDNFLRDLAKRKKKQEERQSRRARAFSHNRTARGMLASTTTTSCRTVPLAKMSCGTAVLLIGRTCCTAAAAHCSLLDFLFDRCSVHPTFHWSAEEFAPHETLLAEWFHRPRNGTSIISPHPIFIVGQTASVRSRAVLRMGTQVLTG